MRLVKIESQFHSRAYPHSPRRPQRARHFRVFMNSTRNFTRKGAKISKVHPRRPIPMEFLDRPFRLVRNLPGEKRRMRPEFAEHGNQNSFEERLSAGGKLQDALIRVPCPLIATVF